ncbi:MAG TPA: PilZ domain-containing protein [Candidatus Acidoferrales bacterium]|nr:PilZ domain-containing protein [Candidatus Acidoferrales bacterium]
MPSRSGRRERRTPLSVPVQISRFWESSGTERTITENVCSGGLRVVAQRQMNPDEPLLVSSTTGDLRVQARVVYCERLRDGRFGVGLHFQGAEVHWPAGNSSSAAD